MTSDESSVQTSQARNSERLARPEGKVFRWEDLTNAQREAAGKCVSLIKDMATNIPKPKPEQKRPGGRMRAALGDIEPRFNHVILLSGKRGSGKTTLLLTLIDALRNGHFRRKKATVGRVEVPQDIVALAPVHFRAVPPSEPILLSVLQGLVALADAAATDGCAYQPWTCMPAEKSELTTALNRLITAAVGWSYGEQRAANIDPETLACELESAARDRASLPCAFNDFIKYLSAAWAGERDHNACESASIRKPLFVISIDDADLNPERCVELLYLTKQLVNPQVVFLLAGDEELFITLLAKRFRERVWTNAEPDRGYTQALKSRALALDTYEKVIPSEHRCIVQPLSIEARLSFLGDSIAKLKIGKDEGAPTLRNLVALMPWFGDAIPSRLRTLVDLRPKSVSVGADANADAFTRRLVHLARLPISEYQMDVAMFRALENFIQGYTEIPPQPRLRLVQTPIPTEIVTEQIRNDATPKASVGAAKREGLSRQLTLSPVHHTSPRLSSTIISQDSSYETTDAALAPALYLTCLYHDIPVYFDGPVELLSTSIALDSDPSITLKWPAVEHLAVHRVAEFEHALKSSSAGTRSSRASTIFRWYVSFVLNEPVQPEQAELSSEHYARLAAYVHMQNPQLAALACPEFGLEPDDAKKLLEACKSYPLGDWSALKKRVTDWRKATLNEKIREFSESHYTKHPWFDLVESLQDAAVDAFVAVLNKLPNPNPYLWFKGFGTSLERARFWEKNESQPLLKCIDRRILQALTTCVERNLKGEASLESHIFELVHEALRVAGNTAQFSQIAEAYVPSTGNGEQLSMRVSFLPKAEDKPTPHWGHGAFNPLRQVNLLPRGEVAEPTPLDQMFTHLAYDIYAFGTNPEWFDQFEVNVDFIRGWPGRLGPNGPLSNMLPWPIPNWMDAFTWLDFCENWNRKLAHIANRYSVQATVDDLAQWVMQYCYERQFLKHPSLEEMLSRIAEHGHQPRNGDTGRGYQRYQQWAQYTFFFATPESGLSKALAKKILVPHLLELGGPENDAQTPPEGGDRRSRDRSLARGSATLSPQHERAKRERKIAARCREIAQSNGWMQRDRVNRFVRQGMSEKAAKTALYQLDHEHRDHPWVECFGEFDANS